MLMPSLWGLPVFSFQIFNAARQLSHIEAVPGTAIDLPVFLYRQLNMSATFMPGKLQVNKQMTKACII